MARIHFDWRMSHTPISSGGWGITSPAAQNLSANYQTFQWAAGNFSGMTAYRMYYQSDYSGGLNNIATLSAEL